MLPHELNILLDTFHVSNLNKYFSNYTLATPIVKMQINCEFHFVEEQAEIMDREIKRL